MSETMDTASANSAIPSVHAIPLDSHAAICAALRYTAEVGYDDQAVVMVKGYGDDCENYTAIYLADYEREELEDDGLFADYESPELWLTIR